MKDLKEQTSIVNVSEVEQKKWHVVELRPTPTTTNGCAVTLTTRYTALCAANMVGTNHYPMTGVIEVGFYEGENENVE